MAISYPLNLPTTIGIESITLRAEDAVGISSSPFTYKQQIVRFSGQQWGASITIPPLRKDVTEAWVAFLLALKGPVGTFLLGDPNNCIPQGQLGSDAVSDWFLAGGTWQDLGVWLDSIDWNETGGDLTFARPMVDGAQDADTETLAIKGLQPDEEGWLLPGDYIQLGESNTATLHKVLLRVDSDSAGYATIEIWPATRRAVADEDPVVYLNAKGLFRRRERAQEWSINNSNAYAIAFEAVEAVP